MLRRISLTSLPGAVSWAACLVLACLAVPAIGAPFTPSSDAEVVEHLPMRLGSAEQRLQQRQARERLLQQPQQLPLALQLAREAIERARRLGDPRELGQAQAALAPWWNSRTPPDAVRLMRATVRQSQHEFGPALNDLDVLLVAESQAPLALQAQAEMTRASVLQVRGFWKEAGAGCARLGGRRYASLGAAVQLPAEACRAELMSLQGQARTAQRALDKLAAAAGGSAQAGWLTLVRAELAERLGDAQAGALFERALNAARADGNIADVYTLAAYADWLLAHAKERQVVTLLTGREDADALLLRLAIAYRHIADPQAAAAIDTLGARFEAAALRGDRSHGREQARFELELKDHAAAALSLAQGNWQLQKEPADAVILLRAAQAAGQPDAAEPVWRMVRETGWEDVRLSPKAPKGSP